MYVITNIAILININQYLSWVFNILEKIVLPRYLYIIYIIIKDYNIVQVL